MGEILGVFFEFSKIFNVDVHSQTALSPTWAVSAFSIPVLGTSSYFLGSGYVSGCSESLSTSLS